MDKTEQIKRDLENYRASKVLGTGNRDIKADLENYRVSKITQAETPQETPSFGTSLARGILKTPARLLTNLTQAGQIATGQPTTQPFSGKLLGEVKPIPGPLTEEKPFEGLKESFGAGLELASYIPMTRGASSIAKATLGQKALKGAGVGLKEGTISGAMSESGRALTEGDTIGESLVKGAGGALVGGPLGGVIGGTVPLIAKGLGFKPKINIQETTGEIDKNIVKLLEKTNTDITKIPEVSTKVKKGFELLSREASNLDVPDLKAPIGSGTTKKFDIANPKDLIFGVNELSKKITNNARKATEEATASGLKLDINDAKNLIVSRFKAGEIAAPTANRLIKQVDNLEQSPIKIFDWVQDVNKNWKADMTKSSQVKQLAEDIAQIFRKELDTVTDRVGYAESFGNNQELKKLLINIAKKTNKNVNFGDISTDAGIDAAFSLITGNPAYLTRSLGVIGLKSFLNTIKKNELIKPLKSVVSDIGKVPTETKLPSTTVKKKIPQLPAPKPGTPQSQINVPINQPTRQMIQQGTEIVPRNTLPNTPTKLKSPKSPTKSIDDTLITEARKYKSAEEFVKAQGGVGDSIAKAMQKEFELEKLTDELSKKANSFAGRGGIVTDKSPEYLQVKSELDSAMREYTAFKKSELGKIVQQERRRLPLQIRMKMLRGDIKTKSQLEDIWKKANKK